MAKNISTVTPEVLEDLRKNGHPNVISVLIFEDTIAPRMENFSMDHGILKISNIC